MKCPRCHYTPTHEQEYCAACGHEMPKPIPSCDREKCEEMGVVIPEECKQFSCQRYVDYLEKQIEKDSKLFGVVQWINGSPCIDGMPAFISMDSAISHAKEIEMSIAGIEGNIETTIVRINLK